ncbi:HAD superfamily hydrolase (TIGR01509 family)/beta-phosphoglucomutase family hydrolase [Halopolyspora algeriensis]|uniref:HAD superfamily hydrolase (TIGR01509 family)/beta-phosphoglucomutase family hydrolase n=1 Tax=Halopolyspora algeriensis TaxID=1500506 RepID=A0A368VVQ1_9ACTN|nr:beta-phosphoglucomutase family hydrolase [Halopolyspora algeriensis]RCW45923.1 HAD superfamily hydrolase (TIGR01509 family)/beta-phosphoglucomutase family hydrolase [Halopolyspora algeriensis]TQM55336.1 HAD superfamily hydrolase (TIGR01509 family)/beta-phosphoglucomutase family hydrolase [Halopolyspora algeriensis]
MTANIDPSRHRGVLFDMDGVLTDTATVHLRAWKRLFDEYLLQRPPGAGENHGSLSAEDYRQYLDGKPRADGVADFLHSRGITLPAGHPDDPSDRDTVHGLGARKDRFFLDSLTDQGVRVFEGVHALLVNLRRHRLATAVVSASRHCADVLERAHLVALFDARVDGAVAQQLGLSGKPDPATLLEAARRLGLPPSRLAVIDDARAGVIAARAGGFALVVGIDSSGASQQLLHAGAHAVVTGVGAITVRPTGARASPDTGHP